MSGTVGEATSLKGRPSQTHQSYRGGHGGLGAGAQAGQNQPMPDFDNPADPHAEWARRHVHDYVATNGDHPKNGHDWIKGATVLLLTTIGHRSGRARRTPLIYARDGDRYLVVASKGGSDAAPIWYENLLAEPQVRIQVKGDVMDARAQTASPEEKKRLWPLVTKVWPDYDSYQQKTERDIPVVIIEPANGHQG
jgi:deazaflavin-dependent oxidoreductase (nitroreductase family)